MGSPRGQIRSAPDRNTGTTTSSGTWRTRRPTPVRKGATTPGSPRLPSGKKMKHSPRAIPSTMGARGSTPAWGLRSMGMPFISTMAMVRRTAFFPK